MGERLCTARIGCAQCWLVSLRRASYYIFQINNVRTFFQGCLAKIQEEYYEVYASRNFLFGGVRMLYFFRVPLTACTTFGPRAGLSS
jgi:hypothetical protein